MIDIDILQLVTIIMLVLVIIVQTKAMSGLLDTYTSELDKRDKSVEYKVDSQVRDMKHRIFYLKQEVKEAKEDRRLALNALNYVTSEDPEPIGYQPFSEGTADKLDKLRIRTEKIPEDYKEEPEEVEWTTEEGQ